MQFKFKDYMLKENLENLEDIAIRYVHNNGTGLMNNNSLNYDMLTDKQYGDVESGYLGLTQPPSFLHNQNVIFAFTPQGELKHAKLIKLLRRISKYGTKKIKINLKDKQILWKSTDGQIAFI